MWIEQMVADLNLRIKEPVSKAIYNQPK